MFLFIVLIFTCLAAVIESDPAIDLLSPTGWAICCLGVGGLPVILAGLRVDAFEPIYTVIPYLGFLYGARGLFLAGTGFRMLPFATPELVSFSLSVAILGTFGVYLGYISGIGDRLAGTFRVPKILAIGEGGFPTGVILISALLGCIGLALIMRYSAGFVEGNVLTGAGTWWVTPLMVFLPLALYMSVLNSDTPRRAFTSIWARGFLLALTTLGFFALHSKQWLLQPIYYLLVLYHYRWRRLSLTLVLSSGVILFAFGQLLRLYVVTFNQSWLAFQNYIASSATDFGDLWESIFNRFYGLDSLAVIILHVRRTGHLYLGATYSDLLYFFVPRAIWPQKPITWSYHFGQLLAHYTGWGSGEFAATTYLGECYLNFGMPGVISGSILMGVVMRFVYVHLIQFTRTKASILAYAVVLFHLTQSCEQSLSGAVPLTLGDLVPVFTILFITRLILPIRRPVALSDMNRIPDIAAAG